MPKKNLFKYLQDITLNYPVGGDVLRTLFTEFSPERWPSEVEDILHKRGIDISHETVRFWVDRFGLDFAGEIYRKRRGFQSNWRWHMGEVFVKINGLLHYLWRTIDHES